MKHQVLIALGSNNRQSVHIQWASERLTTLLCDCRLSTRLWTPDIKATGLWYMNRLAVGTTELSAEQLEDVLKRIEAEGGRTKDGVTIDLDLMQYDRTRYHLNDWPRPYIQRLLSDVLDENNRMQVINRS